MSRCQTGISQLSVVAGFKRSGPRQDELHTLYSHHAEVSICLSLHRWLSQAEAHYKTRTLCSTSWTDYQPLQDVRCWFLKNRWLYFIYTSFSPHIMYIISWCQIQELDGSGFLRFYWKSANIFQRWPCLDEHSAWQCKCLQISENDKKRHILRLRL